MIGNSVLMELIANGTLWYYISYDHKAAIAELQLRYPHHDIHMKEYVPDELKIKYKVLRIGKLRTLMFDPDGFIKKMYVGRSFKYNKMFFPSEVGTIRIKPIINPQADKYGLIQAGLAVDETTLNL